MALSALSSLFGNVFPSKAHPNNPSSLDLKPIPTKEDYKPQKIQYPEDGAGTAYPKPKAFPPPPQLTRFNAHDTSLDIREVIAVINRDGGAIVENLISTDL